MMRSRYLMLLCCACSLIAGRCMAQGVPAQDVSVQDAPRERPAAPPQQQRYWSTQWSFEDIDAGKLAARLSRIGIDVGVPLAGRVTVRFEVGVPWTALGDAAAYRFDGTLSSPALRVDDVRFADLSANVVYRDGQATLNQLHATLITNQADTPGVLDGSGTAALVPRGDVSAKLKIDNIALAPIADLIMKVGAKQSNDLVEAGQVSGNVQFTVPLDSISQIESYQLSGGVDGDSLQFRGLPPARLSVRDISIDAGTLNVKKFDLTATADTETIRLFGAVTVPLDGSGPFQFDVAGDDVPTQTVATLVQSVDADAASDDAFTWVDGKLDFQARGTGQFASTMRESRWDIQAAVASPGLRVAGVDLGVLGHDVELTPSTLRIVPKRPVDSLPGAVLIRGLECDYQFQDDALQITSLDARVFGGRLQGSAQIPTNGEDVLIADLKCESLRPTILVPVPTPTMPEFTASLSGDLKWRVPIASLQQPAAHEGTASLSINDMRLAGEPIGQLDLAVSAQEGELTLRGDGKVLDGTVRIDMAATTTPEDRWPDVIGRLQRSNIELSDLSAAQLLFFAGSNRTDISGRISGAMRGTSLPSLNSDSASTRFELSVNDLRHRSMLVSRQTSARGGFNGRVLTIDSIVGDYAGGTARASGRVEVEPIGSGTQLRTDLTARVDRIDLQSGLFFVPTVSDYIGGKCSGTVRLSGTGYALRVRGNVIGRQFLLADIPLGTAHSGIYVDADVLTNRWKLRLPTITASIGGGSLEGELAVSSSHRTTGGVDLASRWKTRRVDFFRLSDQLGQATSLATGEITGELTLGGKSVRSIDDVAGRFRFRLGETRGGAVPGLVGVSQWLGPVSLATEKFDVGEANGVIGNGVLTMDEFWLGSDAALIRADGRIYLRSKRMDMEALIATGDYRDLSVDLQRIAQQYLLRTLLPGSVILDISDLLRDRTLVVRVFGRIDHPIVRLQTAETFREETARFLIRESGRLLLTGAGVGVASGINGGL